MKVRDTKARATMVVLELLIALALAFAVVLTVHKVARAQSHQTPVYDKNGRYQGSVFDYGKTQTYTDRNGHFTGSSVNNGNGTTSFYGPRGNFAGSAGSSIDRAFNFGRGR